MAGGGNRRNEGSLTASNTNVFAALDSLRKKKKSDKEKSSSKGVAKSASGKSKDAEDKPQVYWAPTPLTVKSWADVDDEDDDDYYATTAPPQAIWAGSGPNKAEEMQQLDHVEESESEDELLVEGDDDLEDEPENEAESENEAEVLAQPEPMAKKPVELSPAPKEAERQLSKKEMKKKELAELDALLADFGINQKEKAEDELADATKEKDGQLNEGAEKKDNAPAESKSAKKKKKKDKTAKEQKEPQDQPQPDGSDFPNGQEKHAAAEEVEEDASGVDLKERLKKVASSKKKKSSKDVDAAARAASAEAAARSARLAAAKKKEKSHYNQQPIRSRVILRKGKSTINKVKVLKDMPPPGSVENRNCFNPRDAEDIFTEFFRSSTFGFGSAGASRSVRFSCDGGTFGGYSGNDYIFRHYSDGNGVNTVKKPPSVESKLPCSLEDLYTGSTRK